MSGRLCAIILTASVASLHALRDENQIHQGVQNVDAYERFRRQFGVERVHEDDDMYYQRAALFQRRSEEVKAHNGGNKGWAQAVNKFADLTDAEFRGMLGHRLSQRASGRPRRSSSFISIIENSVAEAVDYRASLNSSLQVKDQGMCGSCWAVAVAGAMETHAEAHRVGGVPKVSYEQLVDCVANPDNCGGHGGCTGTTSELAFEYIAKHGIALKEDYSGYESRGDAGECVPLSSKAMTADGFVRLPENEARPLLEAVANHGPVVVSADATDWMLYEGGVFSGCGVNALINHAILMMGYGTDSVTGQKFYLIRNSWGSFWGEAGYLRLLRHDEGETYCGVDNDPQKGVGCDGGAAEVPVCGMCGILSDSAFPTGVKVVDNF